GARTLCTKRERRICCAADLIRSCGGRPQRLAAGNKTADPESREPRSHADHLWDFRRMRGALHDGVARMMHMMYVMLAKAVRSLVRSRPKCAYDRKTLYGHVGLCADVRGLNHPSETIKNCPLVSVVSLTAGKYIYQIS